MSCKECLMQIGLSGTRTPHKQLLPLAAEAIGGYRVNAFQKLYECSECKTVVMQGRNTGWTVAVPNPA